MRTISYQSENLEKESTPKQKASKVSIETLTDVDKIINPKKLTQDKTSLSQKEDQALAKKIINSGLNNGFGDLYCSKTEDGHVISIIYLMKKIKVVIIMFLSQRSRV